MDDYDDEYYRAWMAVHSLYKDFLDGWFPSDEPGVMLRMPPAGKRDSVHFARNRRGAITLH
jgi:hypothetical protein